MLSLSLKLTMEIPTKIVKLKIVPDVKPKLNVIAPQDPKKRIKKWTLSLFLERSLSIHGNKYDYSDIKEEHINGYKSHVSIKCNTCDHQ